jgi:anhydro-N-acetylmuramic acid kinase
LKVIGLISGTSMDAIDAALVELECVDDRLRLHPLAFTMAPLAPALRDRMVALLPPRSGSTAEVCALNVAIGAAFAEAALLVARQAGVAIESVDLIASHGQTVYHQVAAGAERSTLQLGTPAVIAERTGRTVVADFRPRDIAAGGQGAPLVPYLDLLLFRHPQRARAVQNIGGMGNVTYLPPGDDRPFDATQGERLTTDERRPNQSDTIPIGSGSPSSFVLRPSSVVAFDTGPGNVLIDEAVRLLTDGRLAYDHDGRIAASGRIDEELLANWLAHPFFQQMPPRSTGRELFGSAEARDYVAQAQARGLATPDIVATLTALTAWSVADSYRRYCGRVDEVLLSGGGARNPTLTRMIQAALPAATVRAVDDLLLDADAKEAIAFAVASYATLHGWPNNVPAATGAAHPVVLGSLTPGANYRDLLRGVVAAPAEPAQRIEIAADRSLASRG